MTVTLDTFKAQIQHASANTGLRFRADDSISTASRSLGGRIVRWFKEGLERDDNLRMAGKLVNALSAEYGHEIANKAFRMARGDVRLDMDGTTMIRPSKPITVRQVRDAMDFARALSQDNLRTAQQASALMFAPENHTLFGDVAEKAGVTPSNLSADQKAFYKERLMEQVLSKARNAGQPIDLEETFKIAVKVLKYTASLEPAALASAQKDIERAKGAMNAVLNQLSGHGRDPAWGLLALDNACESTLTHTVLGEAEKAGGNEGAEDRGVQMDRALDGLTPAEAKQIFEKAMAPQGAGRATYLALNLLSEQDAIPKEDDGRWARAVSGMAGSLEHILEGLAARAGLEKPAYKAEIKVLDRAIGRMSEQEVGNRKPSDDTLKAAGISGGIRSVMANAVAAVGERATRIAEKAAGDAEGEVSAEDQAEFSDDIQAEPPVDAPAPVPADAPVQPPANAQAPATADA